MITILCSMRMQYRNDMMRTISLTPSEVSTNYNRHFVGENVVTGDRKAKTRYRPMGTKM